MRPPSSPCKPHVSDTTPNRLFLRGFSATQFPDFGLCRRSRILVAGFGALSPHLKIPFPRSGLSAKFDRDLHPEFGIVGGRCSYSGLSPSAANCRLHSVGGSRSRSMPMPRGRRPSTAALIRLGARKGERDPVEGGAEGLTGIRYRDSLAHRLAKASASQKFGLRESEN